MEYYRWSDDTISEEEWMDIVRQHSSAYKNYHDIESQRISSLDETEQNVQFKQLFRVMDEMLKLEELEIQRVKNVIKEQLQSEGVIFKECPYTSYELKKKWKQAFLSSMTQKDMEKCYLDEYLWHAFTYRKITDYLEGQNAVKAFDNKLKDEIYIFWQGEEQVYYIKTNNRLSSKHLRLDGRDVFIVDSNFTWTYIKKHCDNEPIWYEIKK